jgi:thioredoxin 2
MTAAAAGMTQAKLTIRCPHCAAWNRISADRVSHGPKCGKCAQPIPLDHPIALTDDTFARTIAESDVPVLVDFYADWCGPCKMMAPSVDELAHEHLGRAIVAKLDTDRNPRTAGSFNIRGIPTTIVFRGGREAKRQTGAVPKSELEKLLSP